MNTSRPMTTAEFADLLDLHGPDLARLDDRDRLAAEALLAADPEARRVLSSARMLDGALDGLAAPEPSAALRRAVAEIPLRHPRLAPSGQSFWARAWTPLHSVRTMTLCAVAVLVLGAASGLLSADTTATLAESDDDWEEMSELAFATNLDAELGP